MWAQHPLWSLQAKLTFACLYKQATTALNATMKSPHKSGLFLLVVKSKTSTLFLIFLYAHIRCTNFRMQSSISSLVHLPVNLGFVR